MKIGAIASAVGAPPQPVSTSRQGSHDAVQLVAGDAIATAALPAPEVQSQIEQAVRAVAEANQRLAQKGTELTFEFDDALGRMILRLVDSETGKTVRQVPTEEALAVARALAEGLGPGTVMRADA
jgi:flagellar protein FlaG